MSRADFRPASDFFEAPGEPFGTESVCLDVTGIRCRLSGLDEATRDLLRERHAGFLCHDPDCEPAAEIEVREAGVEGFLAWRPGEDPSHRVETRAEGDEVAVVSYGFAGRWDPASRRGVLALAPEPEDRRRLSFENFLRVAYSWLAMEAGGFLFHSSALVPDDAGAERAYLFFGPSGAGKTTCCRLSEGIARPVNDDLVLLRPARDGAWEVAAVPFTGTFGREEAGNAYRVEAMFRLVQAEITETEPLTTAGAVVEVLSSVPFQEERPPDGTLADRVEGLVRSVPVRRLRFRKDPSFWEAIRRDLG